MDEAYDYLEELNNFLGGTFHQDINSPEQALDEFINVASIECLLSTTKACEDFLSSSLTKQEKEDIIQNNAEIYFPAIELTPIQWINNLVKNMREGGKPK